MRGTFGALLAERRGAVVGRDGELAALAALFDDDGPLVAVVHGVAGSGKSALLRAFRSEAAERGATVVAVDGRAVEPTPQGFLAAVERALGAPALAAVDGPVLLTVDTAERLRLLDGWLRLTFLPSLPAHARVVLATRDAPGAVWRSSFGELLRTVALDPLSPADAAEVLRRAGLDETQAEWVNRFVRGHPLSLQLAASAIHERPDAPEDAVLPTVVQELAALYLDGLDPATREALDATAVLRRVTLSLLAAVVPGSRRRRRSRASRRCRSSSSGARASSSTTPSARPSPRCCGRPIRCVTAPTAARPGGRSARSWRARPAPRAGPRSRT